MSKREILIFALAAVGGFLGSRLESLICRVEASEGTVLRASRFELLDAAGKEVAFFGSDSQKNTVLAFEDDNRRAVATLGLRGTGPVASPFFDLTGKDGKSRVRIQLGWMDRPILGMSDEKWEGRVILGFIEKDSPGPADADWGLAFAHPDLAFIGVTRDPKSNSPKGRLVIHGGHNENMYFPASSGERTGALHP